MQLRVQRRAHWQLGQWYFRVFVFNATLGSVALAGNADQPTAKPRAAAATTRRICTMSDGDIEN